MKKILIIRLSSLGDVVLTQSATQALRKEYPDAKIHYLTKKVYAPIVDMFNCVDEIHFWGNKYNILKTLKKLKFDVAIDLHAKLNTFIIKKFIRAKKTVTYNKKHFLRKKIVKHKTSDNISSTVDLYFTALYKIGLDTPINEPRLFPKMNIKLPPALNKQNNKKNIGIFPGALHKTKQYPLDQFAELIDLFDTEKDYRIFLFGSKNEKYLCKELTNKTNYKIIDLCGELHLAQLVCAIYKMDVIVSNDSGPMHIAAALQKFQVAIFGSTHPKLGFAPLNKNAVVLSADLVCQPCTLHGNKKCKLGHFNCMRSIKPELIISIIRKQLN